MRRVGLVAALLVAGGMASAAMFLPSPAPELPRPKPMKMSSPAQAAAPALEPGRQPVPFSRLPPPPAPDLATLTEPPADLSQIQSKPAKRETELAKATVVERGLTNDGRCGGRTLTSVRVEPNGTVHVQC